MAFEELQGSPAGIPIEIQLLGQDLQDLEAAAEELKDELRGFAGVFDVRDNYQRGKWEIKVKAKPAAKTLGLALNDIARQLRQGFYGDEAVRITICWTDPAGKVLVPSLDPKDTILVNDLDIRLIELDDETVYEPYILNPGNPQANAQRGDNFRDNIEQIFIPVADKGYYKLMVNHKDSIADTVQHFSLIIEGVSNVFVAKDSTYLTKNNGFLQVTEAPEYPLEREFVWLLEPENQESLSFNFTEFNTADGDLVTIYDGVDRNAPVLAQFSGTLSNPDRNLPKTEF
jgi:hypothetical protein